MPPMWAPSTTTLAVLLAAVVAATHLGARSAHAGRFVPPPAGSTLSMPITPPDTYAPISVWPMPHTLTLPANTSGITPLGPHVIPPPSSRQMTVHFYGCDAAVMTPLLSQYVWPAAHTVYKDPVRSWAEPAFAPIDSNECLSAMRCSSDAHCAAGSACYVPFDRQWNSTHACPPSEPYEVPCGCCVPAQSDATTPNTSSPVLPVVSEMYVTCNASQVPEEGYTLSIQPAGVIVDASSMRGAAYGLTVLGQLLRWDPNAVAMGSLAEPGSNVSGGYVVSVVPLRIEDAPDFSWRGLMVDTSRHYVTVDALKSLIDGMLAARMSLFHWHIVDSPSFPYESVAFPELSAEGSWSRDASTAYTQAQVAEVVGYAESHLVEVCFEFDTPAHTLAWGKSHPEIMTDAWEWMADTNPKTEDRDDAMAMDPTSPAARALVTKLLGEVAALSPSSRFVHVGGDEVKTGLWNASSTIRDYVSTNYGDLTDVNFRRLQAEWSREVSMAAVTAAGKRSVAWQATPSGPADPAWNASAGLPKDMVWMSWLNAGSVAAYAKASNYVVATSSYYLAGYAPGGWVNIYNDNVMPSGLSPAEQKFVLGGQVCLWGETMDTSNVGALAWHVGAAAAEPFWGPATSPANQLAVKRRLNRFLCYLTTIGATTPPQLPSFCGTVE